MYEDRIVYTDWLGHYLLLFIIHWFAVDAVPPQCVPPVSNDVTETTDLGSFGALVTFSEPSAQDNSGVANLQTRTHRPGQFFQVGSTEVCYTFADPSQNSVDCCFDVIVIEGKHCSNCITWQGNVWECMSASVRSVHLSVLYKTHCQVVHNLGSSAWLISGVPLSPDR